MIQHPVLDAHRLKAKMLRDELAVIDAEVRGMEMVLGTEAARTVDPAPVRRAPYNRTRVSGRSGGKQPGALSVRWQAVLEQLYQSNNWFNDQTVVEYVDILENRKMKPTEVRRLFAGYEQHGYVIRRADGTYSITEQASQRFGFKKLTGTSPNENGALNGHAVSAPETRKEGVDAPPVRPSTPNPQ